MKYDSRCHKRQRILLLEKQKYGFPSGGAYALWSCTPYRGSMRGCPGAGRVGVPGRGGRGDGVFVEDYIVHQSAGAVPTCDPWIALAAMAVGTKHMRAQMLDEALEIIVGLWSGAAFSYEGQYFQVRELTFLPTPVQQPRIPMLVGGGWPLPGPSLRAARYDGCCLYRHHELVDSGDWTPEEVRARKRLHRRTPPERRAEGAAIGDHAGRTEPLTRWGAGSHLDTGIGAGGGHLVGGICAGGRDRGDAPEREAWPIAHRVAFQTTSDRTDGQVTWTTASISGAHLRRSQKS